MKPPPRQLLAAAEQNFQRTLALFLTLALPSGLVAQSAPPAQPPSSIKVTTRLVVLDVVVTDRAGRPIPGLRKADFQILENGQPQSISSFEPPLPSSDAALAPSASAGREPFVKNAESPRTILVIDELNTPSEDLMFAAEKLKQFLLKQPEVLTQPTSIYLLTKKRVELFAPATRDRNTLLKAIQKNFIELPPHYLDSGGIQGGVDRLIASLLALDEIALATANQKARKNVIWIGHGIPILSDNKVAISDQDRFKNWVHYTANWLEETQTTVYTVDPRGLEVTPEIIADGESGYILPTTGLTSSELVFESIATESGGAILRGRNDIDVAIASAIRDGGSYYTLSYYPSDRNWDGKYRKIQVNLGKPAFMARTQRGYYAYPDGIEKSGEQIDFALSRAVTSPLPFQNVSFTATGGRFAAPQIFKGRSAPLPSARVVLAIDRESLSWSAQANGDQRSEITLVNSEIASSGRVLGYHVREIEVQIEKAKWEGTAAGNPVQLAVSVDVPARTDHIRLVLRDAATGHLGTFDLPTASLAAANSSPRR